MKRFANISRVLLIGCCLAFLSMQTFGQVVKLNVVAMTPGKLGSIGKSTALATTGLKVVGKGSKAFMLADTTGSGATAATSFTWSFVSRPTASNAVFDSAANHQYQSFTADSGGQYIVSVSINGGATDQDTFWVSTYIGSPTTAVSGAIPCATCHSTNNTGWKSTGQSQPRSCRSQIGSKFPD